MLNRTFQLLLLLSGYELGMGSEPSLRRSMKTNPVRKRVFRRFVRPASPCY
jgi:hypothetical protein